MPSGKPWVLWLANYPTRTSYGNRSPSVLETGNIYLQIFPPSPLDQIILDAAWDNRVVEGSIDPRYEKIFHAAAYLILHFVSKELSSNDPVLLVVRGFDGIVSSAGPSKIVRSGDR